MPTIDTITIRSASAADRRLLADLGRQTFADSFAADNDPRDMQAYLDASFGERLQGAEMAEPGSLFLIAEIGGTPAGFARLCEETPPPCIQARRPIHLQRIYSTTAWIGRGVGPALMRACIAEARRRNADGLWLGVWEKNSRAIRFYNKWGFRAAGTQPFQLGRDRQTDQVLWLPLNGVPAQDGDAR